MLCLTFLLLFIAEKISGLECLSRYFNLVKESLISYLNNVIFDTENTNVC